MIDFEQPFILAFKDVFPNAEIKGCFFHFQQCIWRKIQENGLQNMYAEDAELSLQIRHLCALAFVPMDKRVETKVGSIDGIESLNSAKVFDHSTEEWCLVSIHQSSVLTSSGQKLLLFKILILPV
ncbi:hypothetical protein QTP88_028646 [Uroleucon formosanum]